MDLGYPFQKGLLRFGMRDFRIIVVASLAMLFVTACATDGGVDPMVNQNSSSFGAIPEVSGSKGP
jgi:hypothetical protein